MRRSAHLSKSLIRSATVHADCYPPRRRVDTHPFAPRVCPPFGASSCLLMPRCSVTGAFPASRNLARPPCLSHPCGAVFVTHARPTANRSGRCSSTTRTRTPPVEPPEMPSPAKRQVTSAPVVTRGPGPRRSDAPLQRCRSARESRGSRAPGLRPPHIIDLNGPVCSRARNHL